MEKKDEQVPAQVDTSREGAPSRPEAEGPHADHHGVRVHSGVHAGRGEKWHLAHYDWSADGE